MNNLLDKCATTLYPVALTATERYVLNALEFGACECAKLADDLRMSTAHIGRAVRTLKDKGYKILTVNPAFGAIYEMDDREVK